MQFAGTIQLACLLTFACLGAGAYSAEPVKANTPTAKYTKPSDIPAEGFFRRENFSQMAMANFSPR